MADKVAKIGELFLQGVLDAAAWDEALASLARTLGADHLVAVVPGVAGSLAPAMAYGCGTEAENIQACSRYPADVAKLSRLLTVYATTQDETVPFPVFSQMSIFNGAIRAMGGRHAAVARLPPGGFVAACRGHARRPFSGAEKSTLTTLLPVLSSALALKQQLRALHSHAAVLETAIDAVATGVICLDQSRRVIHANAAGEALLRHADVLRVTASGILAATALENERLAHAIASGTGEVVLIGCGSAWPLAIRVARVPARADAAVATILFASDPRRPMRDRLAGVCAAFGFTRRETEIAELLAGGVELSEIAAVLGITIGNLRGHLNRIFAKGGVASQAQLVALLLSSSS